MIDIVFDGPPSHESGRFVEVESPPGTSVSCGEWVHRDDGYWALRFPDPRPLIAALEKMVADGPSEEPADPEYTGNYDDNRDYGFARMRWHTANDARAALSQARGEK